MANLHIELPQELHHQLKMIATLEETSLKELVISWLKDAQALEPVGKKT
ncbi:MAG: hypothetical protein H6502_01905 [Candidatus Woesearchaeota archaeon]|nr:MAG: hypothetical protein H6502_01905 [Candidatus Woesearchaeota archaeon]